MIQSILQSIGDHFISELKTANADIMFERIYAIAIAYDLNLTFYFNIYLD